MTIRRFIHSLCVIVAIVAAFLFVIHAGAGLMMTRSSEKLIGSRLLKLADNPALLEKPAREFLDGENPRFLHKCLFAARQSQEQQITVALCFCLAAAGAYFTKKQLPAVNE
jgi:hypothetical protein